MKAKYLSMAALALMGALASCQSDDDFTVARPDNAVSINFSVGSLKGTTRSNAIATDDTQREFNQGDQIAVSTNDQEAVLFQCTSTENQTWTEAVPNKFLLWTQPMLTFSAYYPTTTGTSMTAFTLPTDQSSVEKIALADYMTRQQNKSRPEGGSDIYLTLERQMARVIVRISGFGSQYDDDEKTVSNVSIYSQASGIADSNPTGSSTEIQPYAQGDGGQGSTYTALVVPGYGDDGATFIRLTDGEYSTLLVKGIPELEAGNSYTFNLMVGKNRIEVASVTVQDWTTGETLAGGQAEEQSGASLSLTSPSVGQVIGSDGKNYAANATLPTGVTKVAMIAYVSGSNGLAIALADESGYMDWATAKSTCEAKTPAFTGGTWKLPSQDEWKNMLTYDDVFEVYKKNNLKTALSTAGGNSLQEWIYYWSSTDYDSDNTQAWDVEFMGDEANFSTEYKTDSSGKGVRAVLAF